MNGTMKKKNAILCTLTVIIAICICAGTMLLNSKVAASGKVFVEDFEDSSTCTMNKEFWGDDAALEISNAKAHTGNASLHFDTTKTSSSAPSNAPYIPTAELKKIVTAPGEYKLEAYVWFESAVNGVGAVFAFSGSKPGNLGWSVAANSADVYSTKVGHWNRLLFTFNVDSNLYSAISSGNYDVRLRFDKMGDVSAYYDDVTFAAAADMPTPTPTPSATATATIAPTATATVAPSATATPISYEGLYTETFENGNLGYNDIFWNLGTLEVTGEKAHNGSKSLKYTYAKGSDGADHSQGSPYLDPDMLKKVVTKTGKYHFTLYAYFTEAPDKVTAILRTENKTFADKQWGKSLTAVEVNKEAGKWNKLTFELNVDDEILERIQNPETYALKLCLDSFCLKSTVTYFDDIKLGTPEKVVESDSKSESSGDMGYIGVAAVLVLAVCATVITVNKKKSERI